MSALNESLAKLFVMVLSIPTLNFVFIFLGLGDFLFCTARAFGESSAYQRKNIRVDFMKKNEKQPEQWENNRLTIIDPYKVRLSQKGDTVMVFLNHKTVMMFSKKFLEAVLTRSYQKKGA